MKKIITLFTLCLIGTLSFAQQAPAIEWQKCLGGTSSDYAYSIQPTTDGGFIMAGAVFSFDGDVTGNHAYEDAWVVKISSTGSLQWQKTLGGTASDYAQSIQPTIDGGYIMAGYTFSTNGDIAGNHGGVDAWVVKLSSTGSIQWQKTFGGAAADYAFCIQPTVDGGYIMAGQTISTDGDVIGNHGGRDAWVVKLSSTGSLEWQKALGGIGSDYAFCIQPTIDGNYIVVGYTFSNDGDVTGNHGDRDAWAVKLNNSGTLQWQKTIGGTGSDYAFCIQSTSDGGYIMAGSTDSINGDVSGNYGSQDAWVVKLNSMGNLQWQKALGGSAYDEAQSIQSTADGGYIIAGKTLSIDGIFTENHGNYDAWVVKLNSTGSLQWQKALGGTGNDYANSIQQTSDLSYIMAGYTQSNNGNVNGNHGYTDYWVVKLTPELATSTFINQGLTLYPNPTNGLLQLHTPNNTSFNKIIITDNTGKTVLEQTQNTTQFDVEKLASGLYIIKAFSGEEVFVNKFVKE